MFNNITRKQTTQLCTTSKRYWQQNLSDKTQPTFISKFTADRGNLPLIVSNLAGGTILLIFAGRKIFYHPDVLVSNDMRKPGIYNETVDRDECSNDYKSQTKFFANQLSPMAQPIVNTLIGTKPLPVWELDFTRRNHETVETPLEFTSHFDDGLFLDVVPHAESTGLKGRSV